MESSTGKEKKNKRPLATKIEDMIFIVNELIVENRKQNIKLNEMVDHMQLQTSEQTLKINELVVQIGHQTNKISEMEMTIKRNNAERPFLFTGNQHLPLKKVDMSAPSENLMDPKLDDSNDMFKHMAYSNRDPYEINDPFDQVEKREEQNFFNNNSIFSLWKE